MALIASITSSFAKAVKNAPYLTREEERALTNAWVQNKDEKALHKLAHAHMRLAVAIAARFKNYGLPMTDLVQEAHVGLLEAAARFEPERDLRFSTYATWWIRASVQDYVLRNWSIVRGGTSSAQKALFFNLRRIRARIMQAGGSSVSLDSVYSEIASAVGVSKADVVSMAGRMSGPDTSLNAPLAEQDAGAAAERMDFLVDATPLPDQIVEEAIDGDRRVKWLKTALNSLSAREIHIIKARRLDDEQSTLEALGEKLGISKERVRQIESRAMEKLKSALLERHPDAMAAI